MLFWAVIVAPSEEARVTKTGEVDDTITVLAHDLDLAPLLKKRKQERADSDLLIGVTVQEYKRMFNLAVEQTGLAKF
eukprot:6735951-Karenia_brevis.AAC.1